MGLFQRRLPFTPSKRYLIEIFYFLFSLVHAPLFSPHLLVYVKVAGTRFDSSRVFRFAVRRRFSSRRVNSTHMQWRRDKALSLGRTTDLKIPDKTIRFFEKWGYSFRNIRIFISTRENNLN